MNSFQFIEESLATLSKIEAGQKLCIRVGKLCIDKNPNRIYRWFMGDSKTVIYLHVDLLIEMAISFKLPLDVNLITAIEIYKNTYKNRTDVQENFTKLQQKIRNYLNITSTN